MQKVEKHKKNILSLACLPLGDMMLEFCCLEMVETAFKKRVEVTNMPGTSE